VVDYTQVVRQTEVDALAAKVTFLQAKLEAADRVNKVRAPSPAH